ncbi:MAG: MgtC/SapB family protein, partial [bacterium]
MSGALTGELLTQINVAQLQLPVLGKLILASILGGAIGLERELSGKEAGLRTNILICVGSTILTIISLDIGQYALFEGRVMADPSRLMASIISGIGFLGAGTIIQAQGNVTG